VYAGRDTASSYGQLQPQLARPLRASQDLPAVGSTLTALTYANSAAAADGAWQQQLAAVCVMLPALPPCFTLYSRCMYSTVMGSITVAHHIKCTAKLY
jgi:hypothetical protein